MGKIAQETDYKSQLVSQICSVSSCHHRRFSKSPFVDWYLILTVDENAEIDMIRKQYLKLALKLHPDKNKHPKAAFAFKLVSEGYLCLSDEVKRRAFDIERSNNLCKECNKARYHESAGRSNMDARNRNRAVERMREVGERFRKEVTVIEKCLKTYNKLSAMDDYPIFKPSSNYLFQDYSHSRTEACKHEEFRYLRRGNVPKFDYGGGRCESPIFEIGSERTSLRYNNLAAMAVSVRN